MEKKKQKKEVVDMKMLSDVDERIKVFVKL